MKVDLNAPARITKYLKNESDCDSVITSLKKIPYEIKSKQNNQKTVYYVVRKDMTERDMIQQAQLE